jgi:hypothetical protein
MLQNLQMNGQIKVCITVILRSALFCILIWFTACSEEKVSESEDEIQITEREIQAEDGTVFIRIDDFPDDIPIDDESRFGAATHFTGASLSPDGTRLAITTAGVAHGAGWIFDIETDEIIPAAFQYGGSVEAGPWDSDGQHVVFAEINPASGQTLSIADARSTGSNVSETSRPIRLPNHEESGAGEAVYRPIKWDGEKFIFEVDDERYYYNPSTEIIEEF